MRKTNKHYVSPIDIKLAQFDSTHSLSESQQAEIAKYKRVYDLRDHKKPTIRVDIDIWEKF